MMARQKPKRFHLNELHGVMLIVVMFVLLTVFEFFVFNT